MDYILAHDLGTSGNKATLFSTDGKLRASCTVPYPLYTDQPLWAEQDAEDWWRAVCDSTRRLLRESGVQAADIRALSFSGQMMGCLPVDRDGRPLCRAIIWADQRAREESARLAEKIDDAAFYRITGHRNAPSYGIQKAMWIRKNRPEIYEQTYRFLNAKDYMVYRLTGRFFTDGSDATSMDCFDLAARSWSEPIVAASGIDPDKLPQIAESTQFIGYVTEQAAAETGLTTGTKVIMGAGDGVAANVGAGCVEPGKAYCCLGTSAWVAGTSEKPVLDEGRRIVCWAHAVHGLYSPNGTMQYAGGSYKWLRQTVCLSEEEDALRLGSSVYERMNAEIADAAPGAGSLLFLPYLMGERAPRWNPDAKGVWFGLTAGTTRAQLLRSVMEGILINLGICLDIFRQQTSADELVLIGGLAQSGEWQQAAADIFNAPVRIPVYLEEANSMGAAVIAGVGSGLFQDFSVIERFLEMRSACTPRTEYRRLYQEKTEQFNKVYEALQGVFAPPQG